MVAQTCGYTKNIELYTLNWVNWIICELYLNKGVLKNASQNVLCVYKITQPVLLHLFWWYLFKKKLGIILFKATQQIQQSKC